MGLDPGTPGSRPGLKAGAQPLSHPGIPLNKSILSQKKKLRGSLSKLMRDEGTVGPHWAPVLQGAN